jgi:hypothetical protein
MLHFFLPGHIGDIIQVALRVRNLVVNGWGQYTGIKGFDANDQFNGPCRGDQMAKHTFGAAHGDFISLLSKNLFDGQGLDSIVYLGAGSVGVDIADFRKG